MTKTKTKTNKGKPKKTVHKPSKKRQKKETGNSCNKEKNNTTSTSNNQKSERRSWSKKSHRVTKRSRMWRAFGITFTALFSGSLIIVAAGLGTYYFYLQNHEQCFYPGISLGNYDLSGKTYMEAYSELEQQVEILRQEGIKIQYQEAVTAGLDADGYPTLQLTPIIVPLDSSANEREIYSIDFQTSLDAAYEIGRTGNQWLMAKQQYWAWRYGRTIQLEYTFDTEYIQKLIGDSFSAYETPATNADIDINENGEIELINEALGQAFNPEEIVKQVEQRLVSFDTSTVVIELKTDYPKITIDDIQENRQMIDAWLARTPVKITWENQEWEFDKSAVSTWLSFESGKLDVVSERLKTALTDINDVIKESVQEARWEVIKDEGGSLIDVQPFQEAHAGRSVDHEQMAALLATYLSDTNSEQESVSLAVKTVEPDFTPDNIHELGITDILGTGHSNMYGSPYNRRLNIARGVELLNGLLIAPDEEFSLLNALKPFTIENGYYAELVIKGNETVPEVGGGLCQIGTTTFRAVMGAGLDVTSRANHSYAVSYYADDRNRLPGTDATIYDPAPDLKFINDTPGYILLQTRIEGNDLYFDFWGTDDERVATFTPPTTTGWVAPPPKKEIITTDLAPGVEKCTESAHSGTTASFDYIVEYADGTKHEENFTSVYKPWQAVCLVGAQPEPEPNSEIEAKPEKPEPTEESSSSKKKNKEKETTDQE